MSDRIADWIEQGRMADGQRMSDERLAEVFDLVKPVTNWKAPINAFVPQGQATPQEITAAVIWFAGGAPDVVQLPGGYRVVGAGYWEWIGA